MAKVASLTEALENLIKGVTGKGAKYDKKTDIMPDHFRDGLADLGVHVGPITLDAYRMNIRGKGDKLERNAIAGSKAKWIDNYKSGLEV